MRTISDGENFLTNTGSLVMEKIYHHFGRYIIFTKEYLHTQKNTKNLQLDY